MKKNIKINKNIFYKRISLIIIIIIILFLLFLLFFTSKGNKQLEEMNLNFQDRIESLKKANEYGVHKYGWLQVQGTNVDAEILTYTIHDSIDESYGWLSANSLFNKNRIVFIGHNILNVSKTPMVNNENFRDFEDLMAFSYYNFAKDNMYVSLTTDKEVEKIYVIYAIGFYDYDYDNAQGYDTKKDIKDYIKFAKKNSIYKYDLDVNENDEIITIKTCTRMFGKDEKQQFQIDARLLRKNEKAYKYNVSKTKLYDEYDLKDEYQENITIN